MADMAGIDLSRAALATASRGAVALRARRSACRRPRVLLAECLRVPRPVRGRTASTRADGNHAAGI